MDEARHAQQVQIDDRTHVHSQYASLSLFLSTFRHHYPSSSRLGYELLTMIYALYPLIKQVLILGATGTTDTASQPI